ncbi:magnesium transporter [Priestia taiwanensis]|uniref:Magnesium transporter MgtE n=1 Tax=Priestia taiwanensis TaxID=1347902 RepID=A0A917ASP9_9BACI|nr:magnesium transporter [Priestia taiwanensis]MBM7364128.1 magnesium transporter [Priestia taiwanensis]GGE71784.1 magnesium transporter MgtE [Priestia taiwanensis]
MNDMLEHEQPLFDEKVVETAIEQEDISTFRQEFLSFLPYDRMQFFAKQPKEVRLEIYNYLSPQEMAEVFQHLEQEDIPMYVDEMSPFFVADMLADMYADDAVDILNQLRKEQVASLLTIMDVQAAREIKELLYYEEHTAGSLMTTEFIAINENQTVRSAMYILKKEAPEAETIYYIYVTNRYKQLVGVVSLRDLIVSDDDTMISEIVNDRIVTVSVEEDQEDVARKMRHYDFLALPVVDYQHHLLGIITVDDVMDVMEEEASEDYSKLAAVSETERTDDNPFVAARKRLPWLIILLFLGMCSATLIGKFEATLEQVAILAVFIPLIAGMAGNTGTQALAVVVRSIATGEMDTEQKRKLVFREAGTGLITGAVCGVLVTGIVFVWHGHLFLGILVGISILTTLAIATLAGAVVPLLMHRFNIDPAVASGPFITTINDMISILVYFGLATAFMSYLI